MSHPDLDTLADLAADALPPDEQPVVRAHLIDCAFCQQVVAAASAPIAELTTLGRPPLPAAVAARLEHALADEHIVRPSSQPRTTQTVTPLASRRHRRTVAGLAAASVTVLLAGAIGYGVLSGGNGSSSTIANRPAGTVAAGAVVSSSNRDYTDRRSLAAALPSLLQPTPANGLRGAVPAPAASTPDHVAAPDNASAAGLAQPAARPPATSPAEPPLARLRDPATLAACVARLTGRTGVHPLALDYARFQGAPALVIVLPARAGTDALDVYVVSPRCDAADPRYFARLPRP